MASATSNSSNFPNSFRLIKLTSFSSKNQLFLTLFVYNFVTIKQIIYICFELKKSDL